MGKHKKETKRVMEFKLKKADKELCTIELPKELEELVIHALISVATGNAVMAQHIQGQAPQQPTEEPEQDITQLISDILKE